MQEHPIGNGILTARIPREFAAAIEALQLAGSNTDSLIGLNDAEWQRLLDVCDCAHLTLSLAQLPTTGFPTWAVERLERSVADNSLRSKRVQALYSEAAEALQRARVPHVVIKGFTLAPDYVSDPRFRVQNDLDFYIPPHHIETASAALQAIGYIPQIEANYTLSDHAPSLVRPAGEWKGNMYDPDIALGIELHFCFWNSTISGIAIPETETFWRRRVQRRFGSFTFRALGDVDQLGFFALHLLRDIFRGEWIAHHALELATFLDRRSNDSAFWLQWRQMHSPRMREAQAIAFLIAHTWFSARLSDAVREQIAGLPEATVRWIETLGGCPLEAAYRRTKEGRLLQFLLVDNWESKMQALRHAMLPSVFTVPSGPELQARNRRVANQRSERRYWDRIAWLSHRLGTHLKADVTFLTHALRYGLARSAPFAGDRLLLAQERTAHQYAVDVSGR